MCTTMHDAYECDNREKQYYHRMSDLHVVEAAPLHLVFGGPQRRHLVPQRLAQAQRRQAARYV